MIRLRTTALALCLLLGATLSGPAHADSVRVVVNNVQITDTAIALRASFLKLEQRGTSNSNRIKLAQEELIEEALKLQEAERLGIKITDRQVEDAYENVARNLRMSRDKLNQILSASGVNTGTLKDRLRATLAWQSVSQSAVAPRVKISDAELDAKAASELNDGMSYDYLLKEILFVIPPDSKTSPARRTSEANRYRKSFQGCDSAVELSLSYTDAAVTDVGRRHATQLPEAMAKELAGLGVGGITKPRVAQNGVSMLAVCSKSAAKDLSFIKGKLRQEQGEEKFKTEADAYLERLKERAAISTR